MRFDIVNQWILLVGYFVVFLAFVSRLPMEKRQWLFADPKQRIHGFKKLILRAGQLVTIIFLLLVALTPLPSQPSGTALIGIVLYLVGTILVPISLHFFGQAPNDQPVLEGPYRYSRNPQWVGLFFVLSGLAITAHAWLLVIMVLFIGLTYHFQIPAEEAVCRVKYGAR